MKENEEGKEANQKLQDMIEDEKMQLLAEFRESAIIQKNTDMRASYKEGEKNKNLENARKMLEEKIPLETIMKITGLSKEEIIP